MIECLHFDSTLINLGKCLLLSPQRKILSKLKIMREVRTFNNLDEFRDYLAKIGIEFPTDSELFDWKWWK